MCVSVLVFLSFLLCLHTQACKTTINSIHGFFMSHTMQTPPCVQIAHIGYIQSHFTMCLHTHTLQTPPCVQKAHIGSKQGVIHYILAHTHCKHLHVSKQLILEISQIVCQETLSQNLLVWDTTQELHRVLEPSSMPDLPAPTSSEM